MDVWTQGHLSSSTQSIKLVAIVNVGYYSGTLLVRPPSFWFSPTAEGPRELALVTATHDLQLIKFLLIDCFKRLFLLYLVSN